MKIAQIFKIIEIFKYNSSRDRTNSKLIKQYDKFFVLNYIDEQLIKKLNTIEKNKNSHFL